ncbi:mannose-6-phosphate isomerase 2-like isoform X2 [Nymphaea colorata]|uniref:mannose-6-phosphate isomerase 2-like isoform X2 n=1 Tax=Nymphaea colorata TaxID=210225 RepID=UPI00129EBB7F|nr:mannose-6-phosphate isomerase 2-like isoform X2 [Nymphaea colorata]
MKPLKPVFLKCAVQKYEWGKRGEESAAARIFSRNSGCPVEDKPYAELWMGTHDSGPSLVLFSGSSPDSKLLPLKEWLSQNPEVLGDRVVQRWGTDLPFLFKELKGVLGSLPEIVNLVGKESVEELLNIDRSDAKDVKAALQSVFTQLMSAKQDAVSETVLELKSRLIKEKQVRHLTTKEQLALRLEEQYPNDVGVLSSFFLNYVKLNPGEALYLDANEPHAYIYGDCVECMATSDNVVRAGLTPKYRDVETLCSMLTYKQGYPNILKGAEVSEYTKSYQPPFDEFEVDQCCLPAGRSTTFSAVQKPSIFIVLDGHGSMKIGLEDEILLTTGNIFLVPAGMEIILTANADSAETSSKDNDTNENNKSSTFQLCRAVVNSRFV